MDPAKTDLTGAAFTSQRSGGSRLLTWPNNCNRYAAATLFTLFFGGRVFAPDTVVDGENAQDWLQGRYLAAWRHCYRRLKSCKAIAGWGVMNEPHNGFIGISDAGTAEQPMMPVGPRPSPFQTMLAASGYTVKIPVYTLLGRVSGHQILNPQRQSLFMPGFECPWKKAGVWTEDGGGRLLRKDHFASFMGRKANFTEDFLKPFMLKFIEAMKEPNPGTIFFIEGPPLGADPSWHPGDPPNVVNAFHQYDGFTLYTKTFIPWFNVHTDKRTILLGRKKTAAYFSGRMKKSIAGTRDNMGDMPCLLGEFGLPFDLNRGKAFRTGDYSLHEEALSMYYDAVDANLLHSTIWNYTPDNTNKTGDNWNGEDMSIFSEGKERGMGGWLRPYPMAVAGTPLSFTWKRKSLLFVFRFAADPSIRAPTEIFLPAPWFGEAPGIGVNPVSADGSAVLRFEYRAADQRLFVWNGEYRGEAEISVRGRKAAKA
jgi:hypothetical protein